MTARIRINDAPDAIRDRLPFIASSLTGHAFSITAESRGIGRLDGDDLEAWRADRLTIDYAVYSYLTPIAWHTEDGEWHIVAQTFSRTTAHHQGVVRRALG